MFSMRSLRGGDFVGVQVNGVSAHLQQLYGVKLLLFG